MKKFMALLVTTSMLASMAGMAGAVNIDSNDAVAFNIPGASCTDTSSYKDAEERAYKRDNSVHAIYVRHWVTGGSSDYTNHFRGRKEQGSNLVTCGSKWCTVGMNVPIQSNSIVYRSNYTLAGRGNTNHYDYDGVSAVTLHGNMYVNATN